MKCVTVSTSVSKGQSNIRNKIDKYPLPICWWDFPTSDWKLFEQAPRIEGSRVNTYFQWLTECIRCKKLFRAGSPLAKYCTYRCCNDASIERQKYHRSLNMKKTCKTCNNDFTAKRKDGVFCSSSCKQKNWRSSI